MGVQVSCIEGAGIATAAALTAQALGHHRGTAASSAGPASRYSEIQSATQQTGGNIVASTVHGALGMSTRFERLRGPQSLPACHVLP
jgi:hypothetical protein